MHKLEKEGEEKKGKKNKIIWAGEKSGEILY